MEKLIVCEKCLMRSNVLKQMNFIPFRNTLKTPPKLKNHEASENVEPNEMYKNEREKTNDRNRRARATASKNKKSSIEGKRVFLKRTNQSRNAPNIRNYHMKMHDV